MDEYWLFWIKQQGLARGGVRPILLGGPQILFLKAISSGPRNLRLMTCPFFLASLALSPASVISG
jgi:hypothetical protein